MSLNEWKRKRLDDLLTPNSWFSCINLTWIEVGESFIGTREDCDVRLDIGDLIYGSINLDQQGNVVWKSIDGKERQVEPDKPVSLPGDLEFIVFQRGVKFAVRVKDLDWKNRGLAKFGGLSYFPESDDWKVLARFKEFEDGPKEFEFPSVTGDVSKEMIYGSFQFTGAGGEELELIANNMGEHGPFFVFKDLTAPKETYGAGRFLYGEKRREGEWILDFNKAYNPPCSFTPYATCPMAIRDNWLKVRIEAGEKKYQPGA